MAVGLCCCIAAIEQKILSVNGLKSYAHILWITLWISCGISASYAQEGRIKDRCLCLCSIYSRHTFKMYWYVLCIHDTMYVNQRNGNRLAEVSDKAVEIQGVIDSCREDRE